jgi:glycosyltransferase involved in cell wall biosynthesis
MKIAHVSSHGGLNGAAKVVLYHIRQQIADGHEVTLFHRPGAWFLDQDLPASLRTVAIDLGGRLLKAHEIDAVGDAVEACGADVLHSHGTNADRIAASLYGKRNFATVATAHARIVHPHWRRHDRVIAPSLYTAKWYQGWRFVKKDKIDVVPNAILPHVSTVSRQDICAQLGIDPQAFLLVSVGDVCPRKNQSAAIPIVAALRAKSVDAQLVVIGRQGDKEMPKLEALAKKHDVTAFVHCIGVRSDVRDILPHFDMFVSTSKDEQASIVLLEAMSAGLPIASTPIGSALELVNTQDFGLLLDLATPDATANWMATFAGAPEKLIKARKLSTEALVKSVSVEAVNAQIINTYDRAIATHQQAR